MNQEPAPKQPQIGRWRHATLRRYGMTLMALSMLAACAGPGQRHAAEGHSLLERGRVADGLSALEKAAVAEPDNRQYRMTLVRQREIALGTALAQGDALLAEGRPADALAQFQLANSIAAGHQRARAGIDAATNALRLNERVEQARNLLDRGRRDDAAALLDAVLTESPSHAGARSLRERAVASTAANAADVPGPSIRAAMTRTVSVDFRDAPLRAVFDGLARGSGINFVFDREVRADQRITVSVANVPIDDAIGTICVANQLARKAIGTNTMLIFPNTPAKLREHQELAVKTFYLSNSDAKTMVNLLKTVIKTRDLFPDEKLNAVIMRDTPDAVRLVEKVIRAHDQPDPEVLLDVEVLEVKRTRLSEIGVEPPGKFSVLNLVKNPATVVSTATGATTVENNTLTTTQLTLDKLRGVSSANIGIDSPAVNLRAENGDTNILANPRIRVRNREKARIHIGDRVPVITTTSTANVGVAESVAYLDVGLKLEVEPTVFLDNDVGVKVNLEVSNLVREVRSRSGTLTYQIGTRLATTSLRLKDGETQALAGLISDEDRSGAVGVPGLVDLPLLGRLFSSERSDRSKSEIVLLITPRVVRNLEAAGGTRHEYPSGTELAVGAQAARLPGGSRMAIAAGVGGGGTPARPPVAPPAEGQEPPTE